MPSPAKTSTTSTDRRYKGAREAAVALGITESTFAKWAREGIIATNPVTGRYDTLEVLEQREIFDLEQRGQLCDQINTSADEPYDRAKLAPNMLYALQSANLTAIRVETERLKLAKLQETLVDRAVIGAAIVAALGAVRGQILAQADVLAPRLVGVTSVERIRQVIREHSEQILRDLAAADVLGEAAIEDSHGSATGAAAHGGRSARNGGGRQLMARGARAAAADHGLGMG